MKPRRIPERRALLNPECLPVVQPYEVNPGRWGSDVVVLARSLIREGLTLPAIADRLGRSKADVQRKFKELGLKTLKDTRRNA